MKIRVNKILIFLFVITMFLSFSLPSFSADQIFNSNNIKNLIRVPLCRQSTDRTCGVACLQSVIYYYYSNDPNLRWLREDTLAA